MAELRTRQMPVVAQDVGIRRGQEILTALVPIPYEELEPGPIGHRIHLVDYDATTKKMYRSARTPTGDLPAPPSNAAILDDPSFHAYNVYALVMRTLAHFEYALGRRVSWGFRAHQLKVVPHAFEEANAFYSRETEALLFGYYRTRSGPTFLCLSHDIIVHETAHALLDGLRSRFMAPSSPDQAAFHEGYADITALLSVFSLPGVLGLLIDREAERRNARPGLIHKAALTEKQLKSSVLLGLADEMEPESGLARVNALRRSVEIEPDVNVLRHDEFLEPHRRGEILVAVVMRAFMDVWRKRLQGLGTIAGDYYDRDRIVEEGANVADVLLTMAIRALDYTPPIHMEFGDFLSALLTADSEVRGKDDTRYSARATLLRWFRAYGIEPASRAEDGLWGRSDLQLGREGVRFGSLQNDPTEMFRFIWANRTKLRLDPTAFMRVSSVRPCIRTSPEDGFTLRETVAECTQYMEVEAAELHRYGLKKPPAMDPATEVVLEGGSTLILDEYGMLKYEIHNRLPDRGDEEGLRQAQARLDYLWDQGFFDEGSSFASRLSTMHRLRAGLGSPRLDEVW